MPFPEPSSIQNQAADLNELFQGRDTLEVIRYAVSHLGRSAVVSSFGADSVALLHLVAQINRATPVLFIDTEMLFEETLEYQRNVAAHLNLSDVLVFRAGNLLRRDPATQLHKSDPDACCKLRKSEPLQTALAPYQAWISGRKRHQSNTRAVLPLFEADSATGHIKVNPMANWTAAKVNDYINDNNLPRHPLVERGFPSIGCAPCTSTMPTRFLRRANGERTVCASR